MLLLEAVDDEGQAEARRVTAKADLHQMARLLKMPITNWRQITTGQNFQDIMTIGSIS
jgi:hypothetical protein